LGDGFHVLDIPLILKTRSACFFVFIPGQLSVIPGPDGIGDFLLYGGEMERGLLVVGHGSRSEDAVAVFRQIVDEVRSRGTFTHVEGAHMELAEPGIEEMVKLLADKNVNEIIIAPYFLYEGVHLKKDIPDIIAQLVSDFPDIEFRMAKPIGFEPVLADILLKRVSEIIA
jgi:sirohydrochlorin ferrochelatase